MAFANINNDPWESREQGIADYHKRISESAKYKQQAPQRAWNELESLTNKAVSGNLDPSQEKEFKQARREWNRQYKNTPVGIMASGVNLDDNPFGAQDLYHNMSSHLFHDQPKLYDRMYPWSPNKWARAAGQVLENTMMGRIIKSMGGNREPKIPQNIKDMRARFPGINEIIPEGADKIIPPYGIAELIPDNIRNSTLNELMSEDEGIFSGSGRGELSPDFDYEEEREGRELSLKRAFLKSINPYIDYDSMPSEFIETFYEDELNKQKIVPEIKLKPERDEIIPQIEESEKNKLPFHSIRSMPGFE